jgi:histidine triad (HIT) family protein
VSEISNGCIFCQIVGREVPASIVYESEFVLAFLDIKPLSKGHTLIIPKMHYETIFDIPEGVLVEVFKVTKLVAIALKKSVKADGISIIQQNGRAANQEIFHLHVHAIPKFEGQRLTRFGSQNFASRDMLDQVAAQLKKELI